MKIENGGSLSLHLIDLDDQHKFDVSEAKEKGYVDIGLFSWDSQVAVWYARQCNAKILFVAAGTIIPVLGSGFFRFSKDVKTLEGCKTKCRSNM